MFKKKTMYIYLFFALLAVYLFYRFSSFKEYLTPNLTQTQCTQFSNCADCVSKRTTSGNSCYWNPNPPKNEQSCGSFAGDGWGNKCS